ncbi:efflux RND transporter periplasmic adaptor subunit [Thermogutta sp.]|uniref:efflux RND transporter periplasmic adaptor subunit n=1 Tax=Thermogutta sp. TaxID=1962930 RepID=UPI003C7BBD33
MKGIVRSIVRVVPILAGLVVLTLVIFWLSGFFNEKIAPGEVATELPRFDPNVETKEPVEVVEKPYIEEAVGTVKARERTSISARIMSTITKIHVRAGDRVKQGDVLIELDRAALERQRSQAQAALQAAEAAFKQAQDDFERADRLRKQQPGAISEQQFNEFRTRRDQAQANFEKAKQALAEIEVNLSYCTIVAPRDGQIVDRLAEEGDTASPGVPLLTMYDPASLRLEVPVAEQLANGLKIGDKVKVYIDALQQTIEGTVDEKVPQADVATRSVLVKIALPQAPGLVEGMFGRVRIEAGRRKHLCLNAAAIKRIGQLDFVEVVHPDGTKERRLIQVGRFGRPGHLEVLSGLQAGEMVAVPKNADPSVCPYLGVSRSSEEGTSQPSPQSAVPQER